MVEPLSFKTRSLWAWAVESSMIAHGIDFENDLGRYWFVLWKLNGRAWTR